MLKTIFLLTPVYISLFWSILFFRISGFKSDPKFFLGKFMMVSFVIYLSHFLYFTPYPEAYYWINPLYQYASLLVYPLYYIYFRLLTVDRGFLIRKHGWYLFAPTLLFILYVVGICLTPIEEYKIWIFNKSFTSESFGIQYLNILYIVIKIVFIVQVFYTLAGNLKLIQKYRYKAEQYYSDIQDSRISRVMILNLTLLITSVISIIFKVLGKDFVSHEIVEIAIASVLFSSMLFIIGWLGLQQKSINPTFESEKVEPVVTEEELPASSRQIILEKIISLFKNNRIYLNNKLTIQEVAQAVGTNRSYVSSIINQKFSQNFCSFVNNYRIEELEKIIVKNPEFTNQLLAESSGFGSIDSLKRAIYAKNGLSIAAWKAGLLKKNKRS